MPAQNVLPTYYRTWYAQNVLSISFMHDRGTLHGMMFEEDRESIMELDYRRQPYFGILNFLYG